jgi:hypothetical protein
MHYIRPIIVAFILVGAIATSRTAAFAHEGHTKDGAAANAKGELLAVTDKDAAWVAEQKAKYPTTACIVSEDKLGGDMGKPVDFIWRVAGQPDRLVSFCCKDCVKDFSKDPEKYLAILDQAAARSKDARGAHAH